VPSGLVGWCGGRGRSGSMHGIGSSFRRDGVGGRWGQVGRRQRCRVGGCGGLMV
jgi:hypothetical protein